MPERSRYSSHPTTPFSPYSKQVYNSEPRRQGSEKQDRPFDFTALTKTPSQVLATERVSQSFQPPRPVRPRLYMQDSGKFCEFHKIGGHTMDNCEHLKREIEKAVKTGKLSHLVKEIGQERNKDRKPEGDRQRPPPEDRGRVEMIHTGGSSKREESDHKRKPPPLESWMMQSISFESLTDKDIQEGPLVISTNVVGHHIGRIHVDGGSGAEIMFEHCFERLDEDLKARLVPDYLPLVGFSGERVLPVGKVTLPITLGEGDRFHTVNLTFSIVRANFKNNIIMGRPGIKALKGVVSTHHGIMKFPTPKGIASVSTAAEIVAALDRTKESRDKEDEVWMMNGDFTEQTIKVGARLSNKVKTDLKELLIRNIDVFALEEADMEGIPRDLVEHKLNIHPTAAPI
ncbi:hypothetical protein L1987_12312 [Smallanthus sonchifolius]|uniref:Uncharacterized protein n=1 Tax=Smallanthus sonchifolius TaxID=185202 RepID=A0ACB9JEZ0_9ASTR|nr:hypothetical protein L1987_12312 [Smallanthus sonchifolius]